MANVVAESVVQASASSATQASAPTQVNVVQLRDFADKLQVKVLSQTMTPAFVAAVKIQMAAEGRIDSADEPVIIRTGDLTKEMKVAFQDAGISLDNVSYVKIGTTNPSQRMSEKSVTIHVLNTRDTITVTISSKDFNKDNQVVMKKMANDTVAGQVLNLKTDALGGALARLASSTKQERVKDEVAELLANNEDLNKLQGQVKVISIDATFLGEAIGKDEKGVKIKPSGIINKEFLSQITEGRNIKLVIAVPREMGVDAHSFAEELGLPVEMIDIIDSDSIGAVQGLDGPGRVTPEAVKIVAEKKYGKGNIRIHFIAPESQKEILNKLSTADPDVTFSTFEPQIGTKQLRNGDFFITEALKTMIIGKKEMTQGDRKTLAKAILATIKVDMTETEVEELMATPLGAMDKNRTINLRVEVELIYVAPLTWA